MSKLRWLMHSMLCCAAITSSLFVSQSWADRAEEERKLKALQQQIAAIQAKLARDDSEKNALQLALRQTEKQAAALYSRAAILERKIIASSDRLNYLQTQLGVLKKQLAEQSQALVGQVQSAYRFGQQEPLKLVLSQQHPQRMGRVLTYYRYVLAHRANRIASYFETLRELSATTAKAELQNQELVAQRTELEAKQQQLTRTKQERAATLEQLKIQIRSDRERAAQLQREQQELEALLREVEEAIAKIALPEKYKPFAAQKGRMEWPLRGPVQFAYGAVRKGQLRWNGWLIAAKPGTAVAAVHYGQVVFADYLRGLGLLVIVDHGDGYMTLYAHNQRLTHQVGDWVVAGETLAYSGDSGGLDRPSLYFEVRHRGKPQDPRIWLLRR